MSIFFVKIFEKGNSMNKDNLVSVKISADDMTVINRAFSIIEEILLPQLTALTPEVRRAIIPKMNIKAVPFVLKALEYAETKPEVIPDYIDLHEMRVDIEAARNLINILKRGKKTYDNLRDTVILSSFEALKSAQVIHQAFRTAAKANVTGTDKIVYELNELYDAAGLERRRTKKK